MKKPTAIKSENDFRQYIHVTAEEWGWVVNHIESPVTSPGIPDLLLTRGRHDLWIETKIWKPGGITMRPPQRKWHRAREAAGGVSFVMCYIDGGIYVQNGYIAASLLPKSLSWKSGGHCSIHQLPTFLEGLIGRGINKGIRVALKSGSGLPH